MASERRPHLEKALAAAVECHRRGDLNRAAAQYRDIIERDPDCFGALHLLGVLCSDAGQLPQAIRLLQRAVAVNGTNAMAHYALAAALAQVPDDRAALASVAAALARQSDLADAWFLQGMLLQRSARLPECVHSYQQAVRLRPAFPEAFNNLAAALRALRQFDAALASADRALALRSPYPRAHNNRGLILLDQSRGTDAVAAFQQAVSLDAQFTEGWHNLGTALLRLRRYPAAHEAFTRLVGIAPRFPHAAGNALHAQLHSCNWQDVETQAAAIAAAILRGEPAATPMTLLYCCGSPAVQRRGAELYTQGFYPPHAATTGAAPHAVGAGAGAERIRIAYLSGDFGAHAVTYLLAGVFERHDPAQFETVALSWDRRDDGAARQRVVDAFSRFIDVTDTSDAEIVRLLRELRVDIAVDLSGHTLGQRTAVFAQRAAPLQVNFLGLPATMGAPYIDYVIADAHLVPDAARQHYTEQVARLPGCFQPNDDRRQLPQVAPPRTAFGLPDAAFVFCCFNRNAKMNPACFAAWMRILLAVPGSVLWLLAESRDAETHLRREAAARSIAAERLLFGRDVPYEEYLARYLSADLMLDTAPFNGGTTVSDALSMGLPVVTCEGESFAGRMASSLLHNVGLADLVTRSWDDYVNVAAAIASSPARLAAVRAGLRERTSSRAFFDTDRYRRTLERAYRLMWTRARAGLPPLTFDVPEEAP